MTKRNAIADCFFITANSKLISFICRETLFAFKEFNVKTHETKLSGYLKFGYDWNK